MSLQTGLKSLLGVPSNPAVTGAGHEVRGGYIPGRGQARDPLGPLPLSRSQPLRANPLRLIPAQEQCSSALGWPLLCRMLPVQGWREQRARQQGAAMPPWPPPAAGTCSRGRALPPRLRANSLAARGPPQRVYVPSVDSVQRLQAQKLPVIQAEGLELEHFHLCGSSPRTTAAPPRRPGDQGQRRDRPLWAALVLPRRLHTRPSPALRAPAAEPPTQRAQSPAAPAGSSPRPGRLPSLGAEASWGSPAGFLGQTEATSSVPSCGGPQPVIRGPGSLGLRTMALQAPPSSRALGSGGHPRPGWAVTHLPVRPAWGWEGAGREGRWQNTQPVC